MAKQSPVLTEQELEIMKVVWECENATVRDVYETLRERRQIAYTTVMTMMRILERKGHLKVSRADRAFLYRPAGRASECWPKWCTSSWTGCSVSRQPLVQHLVRDRHLTEDDLREIAAQLKSRKSEDTDEH